MPEKALIHHLYYLGLLLSIIVRYNSVSFAHPMRSTNNPVHESNLEPNYEEIKGLIEHDEYSRIVGGQQASIGEYPYFVQTRNGSCGGVLVASEWVLTAVHCGDITGQTVLVGPYKIRSNEYGARTRKCTLFKRDPAFQKQGGTLNEPYAPFKNDIALCKLDSPVHIDDTNVSLRLTNNINYPSVGSDVVAIGFGTMSSGGSQPIFLRDVTVKVDSNSKCALAPNNLYNANTISQGIICASVNGGGKDACQGDSGGPLVRKTIMNGKRVDYHIGVTSWGIGCASASYPGVYSRTAAGYNFIRRTVCEEYKSRDPFCTSSTRQTCNNNQEKLVVKLVTDKYPSEIEWVLSRSNGKSIRRGKNFQKKYFTYEETNCLDKGQTYQFEINDGHGDGLTAGEQGFVSLTLDGKQIAKASNYQKQYVQLIQTQTISTKAPTRNPSEAPTKSHLTKSSPCDNIKNYRYNNLKSHSCDYLLKGEDNAQKRNRICKKVDVHAGNKVKFFCPGFCKRRCQDRSGRKRRKRKNKRYRRKGVTA